MKNSFLVVVVVGLISLSGAAHAALDFSLWTLVGHDSSGQVDAGSSIDFLVQMDTDQQITAAVLNILLPMQGWTRAWYELSDYSWYEDNPTYDLSTPGGSGTPAVIMNDSWTDGLYPDTPDFKLDTSYNPDTTYVTGNGVNFAAFRLTIPVGTAPGVYNVGIRHASAADFNLVDEYPAQDSDFSLRVKGSGAVPEPGTLALALVGLAGLAVARRRRA